MAQGGNSVIVDPEAVHDAYERVRSDGDEIEWIALTYDDKSIVVKGTGCNYEDLLVLFTEDERLYAYYRFKTGDDMSVRAKFAFITWIGPKVTPLRKAKVSTDKAFVKQIFKEFSIEILADDMDDLVYEKVLEKVVLSSGAKY